MSRDRTWQEVRDPDTNMSFIENNKHTQPIERSREREKVVQKQTAERR